MHVIRYASPPSSAIPGQGGHYGEPRPPLTSLSSVGSLGSLGSLGTLGSGSDVGGGGADTPTGTDSPHVLRGDRQPPAATTTAHPHAAPDHADHAQYTYTRKLERAVRLLHERTSQVEAQLAAALAQAAQATQAMQDMPSPATARPLPPASPTARPAGACVRVCEHCVTSAHHVYSHRALKTAMTSRRHAANAAP